MKTSAILLPATGTSMGPVAILRPDQFSFLKKMPFVLFLLVVVIVLQAQTDNKASRKFFRVAVSNSHAAKPFGSFSSLFYQDFHPGVEIGYESILNSKDRRQWFYEIRIGYMFHQWVQHNISLYGDIGYRYEVVPLWFAAIKLGGGYQLSIPDSKVFEITESDGVKKKNNTGRLQMIGNFGASVTKNFSDAVFVFLEYKQQIQTPFIREYVPLLPYNSILIGIKIPLKTSSKTRQ